MKLIIVILLVAAAATELVAGFWTGSMALVWVSIACSAAAGTLLYLRVPRRFKTPKRASSVTVSMGDTDYFFDFGVINLKENDFLIIRCPESVMNLVVLNGHDWISAFNQAFQKLGIQGSGAVLCTNGYDIENVSVEEMAALGWVRSRPPREMEELKTSLLSLVKETDG